MENFDRDILPSRIYIKDKKWLRNSILGKVGGEITKTLTIAIALQTMLRGGTLLLLFSKRSLQYDAVVCRGNSVMLRLKQSEWADSPIDCFKKSTKASYG